MPAEAEFNTWWQKQGYLAGKEIGEGLWIVLAEQLFTYRVMICDPETSSMEFYCYPKDKGLSYALLAFTLWDGTNTPPEGWTRHHG